MSLPRLLFYSDCPVFGGADMLVAHLLNDSGLRAEFETSFVYRDGPHFREGVANHVSTRKTDIAAVHFPDRISAIEALAARYANTFLSLPHKIAWRVFEIALFPYIVLRLRSVFRALRPDIVHINNGGYPGALGCRAAAAAAKLAGARAVVMAVHNLARTPSYPRDMIEWHVNASVREEVDAFVTASSTSQERLARQGFARDRMTVVPDGVPVPATGATPAEVRSHLGLGADEIVFVMTAFFEPRKGHRTLVEAVRRIAPAGFKVILIGDGPERPEVEDLIVQAGLKDVFLFLGYRSDAADVLAAADALVLPSVRDEDMPLVILDAMALGKPVVSTRLAAIPEEVEDGVTGLLAEPGDPEGLSAALKRLASDASLRRRMGEAGRERFSTRFEKSRMIAGYVKLYKDLLARRQTKGE